MSKDQEREAFEHYFSDGGKSPRSVERGADGKYLLGSAHNAWRVWQASRAAMAPAGEPIDRAEVLRLADEMTTHAAMATHIGHMGMDNAAKSAEHRAARAALVRLLGGE